MKISFTDEVELEAHVAAWLFSNRGASYLDPRSIPDEAAELGLVGGSFPDFMLTERGRRLSEALHARSQADVEALADLDVKATPHPAGVVLPFESTEALVEKLRQTKHRHG